ncbi:MAG: ABC transporter permease [Myxococcales bacterium]|nr:MAG: ABC transporter permease [Myxococcales bacterium]
MPSYLIHRFLRALVTVAGVVTLVFLLVRLIPGDPVEAILGDEASPEDRQAMREALKLDRPVAEQYLSFTKDVANGSLGFSFRKRSSSVSQLILEVLPSTLYLAFAAFLFAWLLSIPLGVLAAAKHGKLWDSIASGFAIAGLAIPNIWLGPLLILLFGMHLRWLPLPGDDPNTLAAIVLPTITIGSALAAILTRQTRAAMLESLSQQYTLAARARGLKPSTVLFKHCLRNSLLPVSTVGAAQLGALLSGTVVTEKIFERPGLGSLFIEAFFARDIPVIQGCVLIVAIFYVLVNLAIDLLYMGLDPRVRLT